MQSGIGSPSPWPSPPPERFSWTGWHSQPGCARRQLAAEFGASQALTVRCCLSGGLVARQHGQVARATLILIESFRPRRGNAQSPRWEKSLTGGRIAELRKFLPLPGAADAVSAKDKNLLGSGEGERLIPLNSYGFRAAPGQSNHFNPLKNSTRLRRSCLERIWPMPSGIGDNPLSRVLMSLFFTVTRPSSGELMTRSSAVSLLITPA